jgi:hypothetical protein
MFAPRIGGTKLRRRSRRSSLVCRWASCRRGGGGDENTERKALNSKRGPTSFTLSSRLALKVPSHQIRSAWKCYGLIGPDIYMNCGCEKDFFILPSFYIFKIKFSQRELLTFSALHAIRGYSRQRGLKGNRLPFATASQVIRVLLANW